MSIDDFDAMTDAAAAALIAPCCASATWIARMLASRPVRDLPALKAASDRAIDDLEWSDVEQALSAHPRIGERPHGADTEASWSRQEQSAALLSDSETLEALREGNLAYQHRFGHVFLICATGKSSTEILAALRVRLSNTDDDEQEAVRRELGAIAWLCLLKVFG